MPPSRSGTVLKNKWKLGALVGTGGCAEVYEATDLRGESAGGGQLVAKIAPLPVGLPPAMSKGKKRKKTDQEKHADMIYYEYTLYKGFLLDHKGVVEIPAGGYGEDQNLRYLVMTRLGPDVEAAQSLTGPWSVARTAGYARQMLNLLRSLHEKSKMVFVDVKPENFMFGLPGSADQDKLFIIDFGLSSRYTGPAGSIKPQSISGQVQGTPEYLSLKCHGGASAGRCDDLESLGYVILFLLNGGVSPLPWSGSTSVASGLATKRSTSLEALCEGCPSPMLQYMKTVRGMAYEDTPDYDALEAMLQSMQKAGGGTAKAPAGGRAAARGAAASMAKMKTSVSSKGAKGKSKATPDVELCEVAPATGKPKAQKVTKAAPAPTTSPERPAARRSGRLTSSKECASPAPPPASRRQAVGDRPRQVTIESPSKTAVDGEDFFDARQEPSTTKEEQEDVLEVTKVVSGAGRSGRNAPGGAGASKGSASRRAAAAKQEFVLEVVAGPHKGKTLRLTAGGAEVRVGRNAPRKNGLRLDNDFEVSDRHAVLRPQPDGIHCEDVGSLNGSFVNEDRLEGPVVLEGGDVLQVGQSIVKISC